MLTEILKIPRKSGQKGLVMNNSQNWLFEPKISKSRLRSQRCLWIPCQNLMTQKMCYKVNLKMFKSRLSMESSQLELKPLLNSQRCMERLLITKEEALRALEASKIMVEQKYGSLFWMAVNKASINHQLQRALLPKNVHINLNWALLVQLLTSARLYQQLSA
jgi:hypothetical protein